MDKKLKYDFNDKLNKEDSETQTLGCRQKNPDICACNLVENVCAFARADGICKRPSRSWKKQYLKLKEKEPNAKIQN